MKPVAVLSVIEAKNKDVIVRLKSKVLQMAKPGQYVCCALEHDANKTVHAFIFAVNFAAAYVEIYLQHNDAKILGLKPDLNTLFTSKVLGEPFLLPGLSTHEQERIKPVLIADEVGLPAIFFLAEKIKSICKIQPLVFLFSTKSFPFTPIPSQFVVSDFPMGVLAACPMLEDKKIPSRLISENLIPGCYEGSLSEFLAELTDEFIFSEVGVSDKEELKMELLVVGEQEVLDSVESFAEQRTLKLQKLMVVPN